MSLNQILFSLLPQKLNRKKYLSNESSRTQGSLGLRRVGLLANLVPCKHVLLPLRTQELIQNSSYCSSVLESVLKVLLLASKRNDWWFKTFAKCCTYHLIKSKFRREPR